MSHPMWLPREVETTQESVVTLSRIVETIDRHHPETLADLAERLDVTEDYLSRQIQDLKATGVVKKAYVVERESVYDLAPSLSELDETDERLQTTLRPAFVESLRRFERVNRDRYSATYRQFRGDPREADLSELDTLASRRHRALFEDLKSYCLTSGWPANRVAADIASISTRLQHVGVCSAWIAEMLDQELLDHAIMTGVFRRDIESAFESGAQIGEDVRQILLEAELERIEDVRSTYQRLTRIFDELFDRVLAQDAENYGSLTTVIRALEQAVNSWVRAGEIAVTLHAGLEPDSLVLH